MSEKRFTYVDLLEVEMIFDEETERGYYFNGENCITDDVKDLIQLLNEQQSTIEQQERKIRKCEAEVGRQLKQIIELQDELNECRARPTLATDERGVVKVEYKCR